MTDADADFCRALRERCPRAIAASDDLLIQLRDSMSRIDVALHPAGDAKPPNAQLDRMVSLLTWITVGT